MTDNNIINFIRDKLFDFISTIDSSIVNYVYSVAKQSKDSNSLYSKLIDFGIENNKNLKLFCDNLFEKLGKNNKITDVQSSKINKKSVECYEYVKSINESETNDINKYLKNSSKLEENNSNLNEVFHNSASSFLNKKRTKLIYLNKFKEQEIINNQIDKFINTKENNQNNLNKLNNHIIKNKPEEEELKLLIEEKEKLEKDLLNKSINTNYESTKILNNFEGFYENTKILHNLNEQNNYLRNQSRFAYLKKRLEQKIDLFSKRIEQEDKLFSNEKLSVEEIKINNLNKKILNLLNNKLNSFIPFKENILNSTNIIDNESDYRNVKNDRDKIKLLSNKYKEVNNKQKDEEELWLDRQKNNINTNIFGSKNAAYIKKLNNKDKKYNNDYELLLDNQVEFIKGNTLNYMKKLIKDKYSQIKEEKLIDLKKNNVYNSKDVKISKKDVLIKIKEEIAETEKKKIIEANERLKLIELDKNKKILTQKQSLPIYAYRSQLLQSIRSYQAIVIVGETGSGKTTQIPQYLHDEGYTKLGKIAITQPRRVAAMSVAARVSIELNSKLGALCGYSIRFDDCCTEETKIKYMTDGMLLREILNEPDLKSYSVVIIDEAHERTVSTDIILALIKDIGKHRKDLKILISSATMDAELFSRYFDNAPIFKAPGRTYDVDILYTKSPEADYVEAAVVTALQIHIKEKDSKGDILIFLTGQEDIEQAYELLSVKAKNLGTKIKELKIYPIYSALPSEQQAKIFIPTPDYARKIVLATNIAETSLTIDGIVFVIDSGFCKQMTYSPKTGIESLVVTPISKASANQRAGRAGRTAPGKCFRLYTYRSYLDEMEEDTIPEVKRNNIINIVLMLKSLGINDLINFDFITKPPHENFVKALEQLYALGALNNEGCLTKLGRKMAEFPLNPFLSKMIIKSSEYECVEHIIIIASMLSVGCNIFYSDRKNLNKDNIIKGFQKPGGDHFTLLNVYKQFIENGEDLNWCKEHYVHYKSLIKALKIKNQLKELCEKIDIKTHTKEDNLNNKIFDCVEAYTCPDNFITNTNIKKAICSGFFFNSAKYFREGYYKTILGSNSVSIHPNSSLSKEKPITIIYNELVYTTKEYMREVIEIDPKWLLEVAPHYFKSIKF